MNIKIKKVLWVVLILIGVTPFVITGVIGIESAINGENGFCADCPDEFGMTAFCGTILTAVILFAPIYVVAIIIIIFSILKLKGVNGIYIKKIVWSTLLVVLLILLVLPWMSGAFWRIYIVPVIILADIQLIMLKKKINN